MSKQEGNNTFGQNGIQRGILLQNELRQIGEESDLEIEYLFPGFLIQNGNVTEQGGQRESEALRSGEATILEQQLAVGPSGAGEVSHQVEKVGQYFSFVGERAVWKVEVGF